LWRLSSKNRENASRAIEPDFEGRSPYLHIDLDALDPTECRVNGYQAPNGLSVAKLREFCEELKAVAPPAALTFSAYDPAVDWDKRGVAAALRVIEVLF
jgi:arginase family enzyme